MANPEIRPMLDRVGFVSSASARFAPGTNGRAVGRWAPTRHNERSFSNFDPAPNFLRSKFEQIPFE